MARNFNFDKILKEFPELKRKLLVGLGTQAQNYFFSSFKNQGFDGENWKEVQRRMEGTKAYKYPKTKGFQRRTSPILVGAGFKQRGDRLEKAVATMSQTSSFVGSTQLRMKVNVPYSGYLNEGTPNMPARTFVGQTQKLTTMQQKRIENEVTKAFSL
jgi:hypothetical protein